MHSNTNICSGQGWTEDDSGTHLNFHLLNLSAAGKIRRGVLGSRRLALCLQGQRRLAILTNFLQTKAIRTGLMGTRTILAMLFSWMRDSDNLFFST